MPAHSYWMPRGVTSPPSGAVGITHGGQPVLALDMVTDSQGEPTVVSSGPLRFFIDRAMRARLASGFAISTVARCASLCRSTTSRSTTPWVFNARFEPYEPHRHIRIMNILGLEEEMDCPGTPGIQQGRTRVASGCGAGRPGRQTLFVMFGDRTNGQGSYGGGRFLRVPLPATVRRGSISTKPTIRRARSTTSPPVRTAPAEQTGAARGVG